LRLIFLNRFYWPDEPATAQLLTDLAEALAARGHEVHVIVGPSAAPGSEKKERNGVRIHRVRGTRWGSRSLAGRLVDFVTYLVGAARRLNRLAGPEGVVVAMTDPPMLGAACALALGKRSSRLWHWTQDIYPEIAIVLARGALGRFTARRFLGLRNRTWRRSAGCVTPGADMARAVAACGLGASRIATIPNWAPAGIHQGSDDGARERRNDWNLRDGLLAVYSGNLGRVHDLGCLLDVAQSLRDDRGIELAFIGNGAQRRDLERSVEGRSLENVRFLPPQPREKLGDSLRAADVHFVTLRRGCEPFVFPSKLHGIAAAGRPMIFIGPKDSEIASLISRNKMGFAFAPEETSAIASSIRALAADPSTCQAMGRAAATFDREHGGLDRAVNAWETLLASGPGSS